MWAFISNFSKMKRLDLFDSDDERRISFYKDEDLPFNTMSTVSENRNLKFLSCLE
jgi:hypothetical protein